MPKEDGRLLQRAVLCHQTHKVSSGDVRSAGLGNVGNGRILAAPWFLFGLLSGQLQGGSLSFRRCPTIVCGLRLLSGVSHGSFQAIFHGVVAVSGDA